MTATLSELLDAVRDQIDTVLSDVTDITIHVESGLFRSAEMPAINVYPSARALPDDLGGFGELVGGWPMAIRAVVSASDIKAGEALLWALMDDASDPLSIIAALDSDHQLGGIADDVKWGEWFGYQDFGPPDEPGRFAGSTLPILVFKA